MRTNFCIGDCRSYFVVILLVFAMQSCNGDQEGDSEGGPQAPIELAENEFVLIDGSNGFAFDLFAQVCASEEGNNVFLSPLSVALVFGMAHTGAVGDTAATIRSAFGFDDMNSDEINQELDETVEVEDLDPVDQGTEQPDATEWEVFTI